MDHPVAPTRTAEPISDAALRDMASRYVRRVTRTAGSGAIVSINVTTARLQTTPSGTQAGGELRGLTGLRIVAAMWVVLFHFHFTPLPGVAQVVDVLGPLLTAGALGVDLFFVLSGFVIAYTYLDKLGPALRVGATARFVWARASRLWPVYALVFHLFGLWLLARMTFGSDREIAFQGVQPVVDAGQYLQQLLMVQLWDDPYFDGASWVGATWSISAEWLAYLLFPVAALGFFRLRNLPVAVLAAGSLALMGPMAWAYLSTGSPYYPWSWMVRVLLGFGAGVLMYLAVRKLRRTDRVRFGASVLAVAVPVAIGAGLLLGELAGPGRGGAVIALFPLLVAALAVADRGPALVLSQPWAVHGGHISYGLYLVHIPLFEIYWLALRRFGVLGPDTVLAHALGVAVVVVALGAAALAYRFVEEPARIHLRLLYPVPVPAGPRPAAADLAPDLVALVKASRAAAAALPEPRHAASSRRHSTLADMLVNAERRRPTHRLDYERAAYVRSAYLHAGN